LYILKVDENLTILKQIEWGHTIVSFVHKSATLIGTIFFMGSRNSFSAYLPTYSEAVGLTTWLIREEEVEA